MECNRPDQVSFAPGKLRVRAAILCPRLGRTYLKQINPALPYDQAKHFRPLASPRGIFSPFLAHFVERDRQPQTSVSPVASPRGLATAHLVNRTDRASSNQRVRRNEYGEPSLGPLPSLQEPARTYSPIGVTVV